MKQLDLTNDRDRTALCRAPRRWNWRPLERVLELLDSYSIPARTLLTIEYTRNRVPL